MSEDTNDDGPKTYTVVFRLTTTVSGTLAVMTDYACHGQSAFDMLIPCSSMPWQSPTFTDIPSDANVYCSILCNNGSGSGSITLQVLLNGEVWKSATINPVFYHATAQVSGTLP